MKRIITSAMLFIPMLLIVTQTSFAQQNVGKTALTKEDYLKKSKRQKTAAWIFTGTGVAVTLVSIAQLMGSGYNYSADDDGNDGTLSSTIGVASLATGVYFFIASGSNKRRARAASVFIDMEKAPVLQQTVIRQTSYPEMGVRIKL